MPAYDGVTFRHPAPVARVLLRNEQTGATWADVPMLVDSGADVTLVPLTVVAALGLSVSPDRCYELSGFDGSISYAQVARLELVLCRRTFRGQFLLIDQECGVLGRNVLNALALLLDGPRQVWDQYTP